MTTEDTSMPDACQRLRRTLREAYAALPIDGRPIALLDLPPYMNIGDSLIAAGQSVLLKGLKPKPQIVYAGVNPPAAVLDRLEAGRGVALLCGGGSFGSIWPAHQKLRESLASERKNLTLVQLPQSVRFDSDGSLDRSVGILAEHGDFHMMVRDNESLAMLEGKGLASLSLTPDSAFAIKPPSLPEPISDLTFLCRNDAEVAHADTLTRLREHYKDKNVLSGDWAARKDLPIPTTFRERAAVRIALKLIRATSNPLIARPAWNAMFGSRLSLGLRLVASGRVVVTDRLHVHILCVLCNKPHLFFDNSYKKIGNFAAAWGTAGPRAVSAEGFDDAQAAIDRLLGESGAA